MGSASSRQKITAPLFDAASSLLRRRQIWDKFQVLVQKITGAVGFGQKSVAVSQTEPSPIAPPISSQPTIDHRQTDIVTVEPSRGHSDNADEHQAKDDVSDVFDPNSEGLNTDEENEVTNRFSRDVSPSPDLKTSRKPELVGESSAEKGEAASRISGAGPVKDVEASEINEPDSGSVAGNDKDIVNHEPISDDALEIKESDIQVSKISKALENAVPEQSATSGAGERHDISGLDASGIENSKLDRIPIMTGNDISHKAESKSVTSVRKTYESRTRNLSASYGRMAPESKSLTELKAMGGTSINDYNEEVIEHVTSSLVVALPQPHHSTHGTELTFRSPVPHKIQNNPVFTDANFAFTSPTADNSTSVSNQRPSEPEVEAATANYLAWDREVYTKLSLDRRSIRLAEILPGVMFDDVHILMDVYPLNEVALEYEALSYVWGNPDPKKMIFVNKVEVPVNPNLYDALISLRHHKSVRRIWTDAICLNQQSAAEQSREVQKMGQIYSLAKTVVIFLGSSTPRDLDFINHLFRFLNRDNAGEAAIQYSKEGWRGLDRICKKCESNVLHLCKGFIEACQQPWWSRIWTLQEFYLAEKEPIWHWGRTNASNESLKRDFNLLMRLSWDISRSDDANGRALSDLVKKTGKPIGSLKVNLERNLDIISRRYQTDGFDTPRRMYRKLTARATNPRDIVYGLRAIFDPVFGRVFLPDYFMNTELLFACLAVFLIQFECWGDVLWWYPSRYAAGTGNFPSWLPNFTKHVVPHELDVNPLDEEVAERPEPKLLVLNHRLHAEGYMLDKVYAHRHLREGNDEEVFKELWRFDHCMNNNHECHEYFVKGVAPEDLWYKVFLDMYGRFYAKWTHFNSAFRGALLQSTMKPEDSGKLPRQIAECMPCWDLLQWHALRISTPGLPEALGSHVSDTKLGYLDNIFSPRMKTVFRNTMAGFFIGACICDWDHLSVWLNGFSHATQWSEQNDSYWSSISEYPTGNMDKRKKAISDAYDGYSADIWPQVSRVSWCYSFYYTFLAYVILLDCDDHISLASMIQKLQTAANDIRRIYISTPMWRLKELAVVVPSIATRLSNCNTMIDLFRGRYLFWTDGGFRGVSCPGVETCCDNKSVVAIVDGLSFPVIVRDYDVKTGEGWLAGCVLIRGVDMLSRNTETAGLPSDYKRGEKRIFKFR